MKEKKNTLTEKMELYQGLEKGIVNLLLKADGSTTQLLEMLVNDKLEVQIHQQDFVKAEQMPKEVACHFKNDNLFLYRIMSLNYNGETISENVVISPRSSLDAFLQKNLFDGQIPLGKLINQTEHKRVPISQGMVYSSDVQHLFATWKIKEGLYPSKEYFIVKEQDNWFYICELFHYKTIYKYFIKMILG